MTEHVLKSIQRLLSIRNIKAKISRLGTFKFLLVMLLSSLTVNKCFHFRKKYPRKVHIIKEMRKNFEILEIFCRDLIIYLFIYLFIC
jgi:hypothetical protein